MSTSNCHRCGKQFKTAGLTTHILHCLEKDRKKRINAQEIKKNIITTPKAQKVNKIITQKR